MRRIVRIVIFLGILLTLNVSIGEAKQNQTPTEPEPNPTEAVVRVKKICVPETPEVGQKAVYSIWGDNDGGDSANALTIVDYVDSNMALYAGADVYGNIFTDSASPTWGKIDVRLDYMPRKIAAKFSKKTGQPKDKYFRTLTRETPLEDVGAVRWSFIKRGYIQKMGAQHNPTLAPDNGNDDRTKIDDTADTRPAAKADVDALYVRFTLVRKF